jgi:hypothetical protein
MQRRTTDFWLQPLSSLLPFKPHSVHLQDTLQGSLVLTQTNVYNTDAKSCKHTLSILDTRFLFNMPLSLRLGPLRFSSFPRHQPSISIASRHYTTAQQSHWRSGEFQQLAKQLSKQGKNQKTNHPECCSCLLFPVSNRHHLLQNLPTVSFLASFSSLPCTVTILTSQKS